MQRRFLMSAIDAVVAIRRYLKTHPEATAEEASIAMKRGDADYAAIDFQTGLALHALMPPSLIFDDYRSDLRECIEFLVRNHTPWWATAIPYGRERVAVTAGTSIEDGVDELQCFRSAGLYDEPPPKDVVIWWDQLAQQFRSEAADELLEQGRYAEQLSMDYEIERLRVLGIDAKPKWIAIEDNGAGFDIQSYDRGPSGLTNRLIEVKSSRKTPPRIILTRGEWEAALRYKAAYTFHIWHLPAETFIERSVDEIGKSVPEDRKGGYWLDVEILIEPS